MALKDEAPAIKTTLSVIFNEQGEKGSGASRDFGPAKTSWRIEDPQAAKQKCLISSLFPSLTRMPLSASAAERRLLSADAPEPIVRALLERDDERALAQLRPLPKYGSTLGPLILEHVARKQSLGLRYDREADLLRFDRFLQGRSDLAGQSLSVLLDAWRHSTPGVRHELRVQQCGRALSQALYRRDMTTPILSIEAGLQRRVSNLDRKPYIFTEAEVDALFHAARTFPSRNAPLLPIALYAMLTVAYCAGLRLGEIAALTLGDLDPENGLLEIRDTKFFKSRRLPLTPSVIEVLSGYLKARAATGAPSALGSPLWWSGLRRRPNGIGGNAACWRDGTYTMN